MYPHNHNQHLLLAVLFLVSLLALVLLLTVRFSKPTSPKPKRHYAEDFDHGSFRDLGFIALILLLFLIIYLGTSG
jgi:heme A synthase